MVVPALLWRGTSVRPCRKPTLKSSCNLQRAREKFPQARPRIISDQGSQFVARDFKEFIRLWQTSHVPCSPQGVLSYITRSALLNRPGWTRDRIDEILGAPDFYARRSSGCGPKIFCVLRVECAEKYLPKTDSPTLPGMDSPTLPLSLQPGAASNGYCDLLIHTK
jgi:hypothetical protein